MTANGWFQILVFFVTILAITKPMGIFMVRVFNREKTFLDSILRPIEKFVYLIAGIDEAYEMRWTEYAIVMVLLSGVSIALL
jgi:K+-transporting ATPase ATPase A chain